MKPDFFSNSCREVTANYPEAVKIGKFLYCAGINGINKEKKAYESGDISIRLAQCFENINSILKKSGSSTASIIRLRVYLRNIRLVNKLDETMLKYFEKGKMPARTVIEVHRLIDEQDIEIEAVAYLGEEIPKYFSKEGNCYSDTVEVEDYIFCSGELSTSFKENPESFEAEMVLALESIKTAVEKHDTSMQSIWGTTVYISNILDISTMNDVYKNYFSKPLRATIEPGRVTNNKRVLVECTAYKGEKTVLFNPNGHIPTGAFSQGYKIGNYFHCSGVRPMDTETKKLIKGNITEHTAKCIENASKILMAENVPVENVYECRIFMRNLINLPAVNEAISKYFPKQLPILTAVEINRLNEDYDKGWEPFYDIEIQLNAYKQ